MNNKEQKITGETAGHPQKGGRWKKILVRVLVGWFVLGAISSLAVFFAVMYPKKCDTTECFVSAAASCKSTALEIQDDAGTLWKYRSRAAYGGCGSFTKTAIRLNQDEAPHLKELLEGKSLTCTYKDGEFDGRWLTSLVSGIDNCDGELKEALGQLLFLLAL